MSDAETTVMTLRERVAQFARERDWEQFHTPKDLAAGLAIEAAELLELFLWKTLAEVDTMVVQPEARARMAEELADILIFSLNFPNHVDLDASSSVIAKLETNAAKYPIDKAKGSSKNYSEYEGVSPGNSPKSNHPAG